MKLQRLLMIVFYLQLNTKATINELSHYLEVSRRTICRDIEMLLTAGVNIVSCKGKTGGYRLADGFSLETLLFNQSDLSAMLMSTQMLSQFKDTDFAKEADVLRCKIEKLINKGDSYASVSDFLLIDTGNDNKKNGISKVIHCFETAYHNRTLLNMSYNHPICGRLSTSNLVAPYGLVHKSGEWYLVGFCYELHNFRIFQSQFVSQCNETDITYEKEPDFNLNAFWQKKSRSLF